MNGVTGGDIKYAVRALARRPAFTAVLLVTLALGIGVNAAILSVARGSLLHAPPADALDELVAVYTTSRRGFPRSVWTHYAVCECSLR